MGGPVGAWFTSYLGPAEALSAQWTLQERPNLRLQLGRITAGTYLRVYSSICARCLHVYIQSPQGIRCKVGSGAG